MFKIIRTHPGNIDFIGLVRMLDADLAARDGADHSFYDQFNKFATLKYAVIAYEDDTPAGCGALKEFAADTMEVKRMFVIPQKRSKGIASKMLTELEKWAAELLFTKCILETGVKQPEAIRLYSSNGYVSIPNYGQYAGVENSLCFEKILR